MALTVLQRAATTALTTVEHVQSDLGAPNDAATAARIARFINQASARAASYCRRSFGRETIRERIDLCRERFTEGGGILLDRGPAFRVASAAIDGVAYLPESFLIAEGRELFLLQDGDTVRWSGRSLSVVYEAGWVLPEDEDTGNPPAGALLLPDDVERAVIQLVGVALSASGRDVMVKSESNDGVGDVSYYIQGASAALPHPEAEATLAQYRRLAFA